MDPGTMPTHSYSPPSSWNAVSTRSLQTEKISCLTSFLTLHTRMLSNWVRTCSLVLSLIERMCSAVHSRIQWFCESVLPQSPHPIQAASVVWLGIIDLALLPPCQPLSHISLLIVACFPILCLRVFQTSSIRPIYVPINEVRIDCRVLNKLL